MHLKVQVYSDSLLINENDTKDEGLNSLKNVMGDWEADV